MLFDILASMDFSVHTTFLQLIGFLSIVVTCLFVSSEILDSFRTDIEVFAPEALTDSQQPLSGFWGQFGTFLFGSVEPLLVPESFAPKQIPQSYQLFGNERIGIFQFESQWMVQMRESMQDLKRPVNRKHPKLYYRTE